MNSESLVSLKNVSKIYGSGQKEVYAVRDVTLAVQPGEFFSLLGSSGSGKTTTLRLIGGFEIPEYGQVSIGGEDVTTLPPYRRAVHTVFQSYALFPHMTVAENIAYPLQIAQVGRGEAEPRVAEAMRMFRIEGLGDRRPSQLSGGQQQRVALARALISRPKVLLLDEPLSALDAKIREEVRQELRELQRQTGLTFIYVTHDQEEALALSDRLAVMHNGQVQQLGSPKDIYNWPASHFVAQFIGKANFLKGAVLSVESTWATVAVNGVSVRVLVGDLTPAVGGTATVMLRPERLRLVASADPGAIAATVRQVTYIGQIWELVVDTPLGRLMVTQLGGQFPPAAGDACGVVWEDDAWILLRP
ncbi:MAG: ABC transporter ATP-binding protein [Cyanobacteria bacterium J069]|nr:MAG: ABC transporter ATP-binding protein [Cyanobacteria bacterium J069]